MIYGYARVSSRGQARDGNSLEAQRNMLIQNGAEKIYSDAFSGMKRHRPELDKLMVELKQGDTLLVTKLDRIARSAIDGIDLINGLIEKGITVNVLNIGKMDDTPTGKLIRTIFFGFAEFERNMIVERTYEGREIAKANNPDYREGRKPLDINADLFDRVYEEVSGGSITVNDACRELNISRTSWYKLKRMQAA